jgi:hypothetical protein
MCITGIMLSNDKPVPNNDSGKGNNYEKWDIASKLDRTELKKLLKLDLIEGKYISNYDSNFSKKLSLIVRKYLKSEERFSAYYASYIIKINYSKSNDNQTIDTEIIWSLPDKEYYFFDQVQFYLFK